MKLNFLFIFILVWLTAITETRREGNGHRARRDDVYSLRRYVRRLKGCLQNARISYNRLQATLDDTRAYSHKLLDDCMAENEELREQVKALEEENNQPEPPGCCVQYDNVCHEEGSPFNTTDGCHTCICSSESLNCTPVPGACLATCSYADGVTYNVGDLFFAFLTPVCGICTCQSDGTVECLANIDCDIVEEFRK